MDGFDARSGVIILGATNRPEVLDAALLRPGRFDRQVLVDKPDLVGREAILKIHSAEVKLEPEVDLHDVARATPGFAGADLANIVNEAALLAVRARRKLVSQRDFSDAIDKVVAGLEKRSRVLRPGRRRSSPTTRRATPGGAPHAGIRPGTEDLHRAARTGSSRLHHADSGRGALPAHRNGYPGRIDVLLGGRGAEEVVFGRSPPAPPTTWTVPPTWPSAW